MQQAGPTEDSVVNHEGKFLSRKMKQEPMEDAASSGHDVAANDKNKVSSSNDQETNEEEKMFSCSSCSRKFSSQYAMAGHRNIHRSEWEFLLDEDNMQNPLNILRSRLSARARGYPKANPTSGLKRPSLACPLGNHKNPPKGQCLPRWPLANPINALKRPPEYPLPNRANSLGRLATCPPRCPLINPLNTLQGPSPRYPLANPTSTLKGQSSLANPTNTLMGSSSLGASHYTFLCPTKTLRKPLVADLTHPLHNHVKPHGKLALGVRHLSMIHKPFQFKQAADMWSRVGSTSFGRKQMMEGNIRRFGTNDKNAYLRYLSTAEGVPSSRPEGGGSNESYDFFSSCFQYRGGTGIEAHNLFAPTIAMHPDNNIENGSSLDIDLDLKL